MGALPGDLTADPFHTVCFVSPPLLESAALSEDNPAPKKPA